MVKLNLGCGKEVKEGFDGVDGKDFGQRYFCDLTIFPWELVDKSDATIKNKLGDKSVDEIYSRHLVPCLTNYDGKFERIKFFNEIYRVMKDTAIATIIVPAWNSAGGYGNPHFQEQFYEGSLYFLNKEWRTANAPEVTEYTCDFDPTWGYNLHPNLVTRNQEYQQFALSNYCNGALDIIITLKKRPIAIT